MIKLNRKDRYQQDLQNELTERICWTERIGKT